MNKSLRLILLLFGGTLAASLLFIIVTKQSPSQTLGPAKPLLVADPPTMVFVPGAPQNVRFSFDASAEIRLAESLPLFTVTPPSPTSHILTLTEQLKLGTPSAVSYGTTKKTVWSADNNTLSYTKSGNSHAASFQSERGFSMGQVSPRAAAEKFIGLLLGDAAKQYTLSSQQPLADTEGGSAGAEATMFLFSYVVEGTPVLLANFDRVSASAVVDENNRILSSSVVFPPGTNPARDSRAIVSSDGVLASLNAGKGLLLSTYAETGGEYGETPDFTSVVVSRVTTAYFYDERSLLLAPSLLIDGVGESKGKKQVVQYFLRATK